MFIKFLLFKGKKIKRNLASLPEAKFPSPPAFRRRKKSNKLDTSNLRAENEEIQAGTKIF